MKKKLIGDEEFIEVGSKIASEHFSSIYLQVGLFLAMTLAEIFEDDEQDEDDKQEAEKEDCVVYRAGNYKICIATRYDNKAHLVITLHERIVVDRVLDSVHKAHEYAFNILVAR